MILFYNWQKSNARKLSHSYAFKWYADRRTEKSFMGSKFVQKFGPLEKKRRLSGLIFSNFFDFFNIFENWNFCDFLVWTFWRIDIGQLRQHVVEDCLVVKKTIIFFFQKILKFFRKIFFDTKFYFLDLIFWQNWIKKSIKNYICFTKILNIG